MPYKSYTVNPLPAFAGRASPLRMNRPAGSGPGWFLNARPHPAWQAEPKPGVPGTGRTTEQMTEKMKVREEVR